MDGNGRDLHENKERRFAGKKKRQGRAPLVGAVENGMGWGTCGRGRPPGGPLQHGNFVALKAVKTASRTWKTGKKLQECQENRFADKKGLEGVRFFGCGFQPRHGEWGATESCTPREGTETRMDICGQEGRKGNLGVDGRGEGVAK
jgi:hypothetical protein